MPTQTPALAEALIPVPPPQAAREHMRKEQGAQSSVPGRPSRFLGAGASLKLSGRVFF